MKPLLLRQVIAPVDFVGIQILSGSKVFGYWQIVNDMVIDNFIHQERLDTNGSQKTFKAVLNTLPDGIFIAFGDTEKAFLWYQQNLYEWSFSGYTKILEFVQNQEVDVLTPLSYVEVFKVGYLPQIHSSAK
jgi:hypothetical protein